ncbi:cysteine dioxygenase [Roseomonas sp. SSH11]|uniref:Cysteine dioxygenase n=1 Tax=Pararoseomonas baculiformis TaxID=2820812 RepID=A0ABS4AA09_9PROT|nr:cysteine dioxygenase [Pararoseomonas baculiformis]MBP0443835.1 cysteine dioxygenase [Pararoseomonas baculiformis]
MDIGRLRDFVTAMTRAADATPPGAPLMQAARPLLARLIAQDDWLPESCAVPHPQYYRQYLLHCDPAERFSLVSFVWGPGQRTPIHDHTVWGLIGMLRGAEISTPFARGADGNLVPSGQAVRLEPGEIDAVAPEIGDIHQVVNAFEDRVSVSIHLYGGNIGAVNRHVFDMAGHGKSFISGYSNDAVPNLWDRSRVTS